MFFMCKFEHESLLAGSVNSLGPVSVSMQADELDPSSSDITPYCHWVELSEEIAHESSEIPRHTYAEETCQDCA
jgi:hypothetical protein